jgi:hypothetical protein
LAKASPPLLHYPSSERFSAIHRLKFGVYRPGFSLLTVKNESPLAVPEKSEMNLHTFTI